MAGEKIPNWECLFVHRQKDYSYLCFEDDIKLAGKKQNLDPMWKVLNKEVDLGEQPTSFLDHVYLGLHSKTMRNKQRILWTITEPCSNREFQRVSSRENYLFLQIFVFLHGRMIWLVMQKLCGTIL